MKAWVQRVSEASVDVGAERIASIGKGYLVLLGITHADTPEIALKMAARIPVLRLFEDEGGHMNRSLQEIGGSVIVVSQFTLYADTARGRRPGFSAAAPGPVAEPLYELVVAELKRILGPDKVGTGRFGADMQVALVNDGPVSVEVVL